MKHVNSKTISGYVTIQVKGTAPEMFFQKCANAGISVWDVRKKITIYVRVI